MTSQMLRRRLSATQTQLQTRWKQGERLSDIAPTLGGALGTVYAQIRKAGGIPEHPRQRVTWALSAADRERLSRGNTRGWRDSGVSDGAR
jgi:hypothetical protein